MLTRGERNQPLARELGADSVGAATDTPPEPLDGAIMFAPAGELVPVALQALDRGGTLAMAGIWSTDIPALNYERDPVRGAPATQRHRQHPAGRRDVPRAGRAARRPGDHRGYPMSEAPRALSDLKHGRFDGAAVLMN